MLVLCKKEKEALSQTLRKNNTPEYWATLSLQPCAPLGSPLELTGSHLSSSDVPFTELSSWEAEAVSLSSVSQYPAQHQPKAGTWCTFIDWIKSLRISFTDQQDCCGQSKAAICNVTKARMQMLCDLRLAGVASRSWVHLAHHPSRLCTSVYMTLWGCLSTHAEAFGIYKRGTKPFIFLWRKNTKWEKKLE